MGHKINGTYKLRNGQIIKVVNNAAEIPLGQSSTITINYDSGGNAQSNAWVKGSMREYDLVERLSGSYRHEAEGKDGLTC